MTRLARFAAIAALAAVVVQQYRRDVRAQIQPQHVNDDLPHWTPVPDANGLIQGQFGYEGEIALEGPPLPYAPDGWYVDTSFGETDRLRRLARELERNDR